MNTNTVAGTTSVIIPCWNQVEYTRQCVAALLRHTRNTWELIVVDNGSTDRTAEYLANIRDAAPLPVTVIANTTNQGFPAAINQGLKCARGEYLVLLNNDVVVTDGWLEQLTALAAVAAKAKSQVPNLKPQMGRKGFEPPESRSDPGRNITVVDLAHCDDPAGKSKNIGLVGPMSNYAAPPQLVEDVPYRDLGEMDVFARRWRDEHRGKWRTVPKLSGFCLLMKRAVYDAIGGLDTAFGLGFFDDDDLAMRARRAGFELAIARDLFVHHFGSRTFVDNGVDAEKLLDENAVRFAAKWGLTAPAGRRVSLRPFAPHPPKQIDCSEGRSAGRNGEVRQGSANQRSPSLHLHQAASSAGHTSGPESSSAVDRARVSLTMIVRDEQENLSTCLESVRRLFDEIVVVDTGSKDRTVEIARSFGARVFEFVWVDDFAAARNAALAHATGDYAFWLDADDLIEPAERKKLEALLVRLRRDGERPAFVVRCACDSGPGGSGGETVVDHIRLFPLLDGVRWTYKVHEQILPSLRRARVRVEWTDITVRHTGYVDRAVRNRKLERDVRILLGELGERPDDPFVLFNLGMIAVERKEWGESLTFLKRSLAGSAPSDSITRKLYALIARVHEMLGDTGAALRTCGEGLSLDPEDAELWFRKGVAHRHRGESDEAESAWRRILSLRRPEKFASMDQGIYGHVTRRNLAALARERGDLDEAQRLWLAVLAECPDDREAIMKAEG